jgi:hypothetical protein
MIGDCRTGFVTCDCGWQELRRHLEGLVEHASLSVDAEISEAAYWSGPIWITLSPDMDKTAGHDTIARHVEAFNRLITVARSGTSTQWSVETLCELHGQLTGVTGMRSSDVGTRSGHVFPNAGSVPPLLADVCAKHRLEGSNASYCSALSLHLDLLVVHPFEQANGRVARLVTASELAGSGYKSTLFTIVEQQYLRSRHVYARLVDNFWNGRICRESCLNGMLLAVLARTDFVVRQLSEPRRSPRLSVDRVNARLATIVEPLLGMLTACEWRVERNAAWSIERADQLARWDREGSHGRYFGKPYLGTRPQRDLLGEMARAPLGPTETS